MILEWLSSLPHAVVLQRSYVAYLLVNTAHIVALGVLIGSILPLDLRMLGALRKLPLNVMGPFLSRMAAWGLACAILTGFWLFSVQPLEYAANPAFLAKISLVIVGVLNALWLHGGGLWQRACRGPAITWPARLHAALSLLVWLSAAVAGRWIGFL